MNLSSITSIRNYARYQQAVRAPLVHTDGAPQGSVSSDSLSDSLRSKLLSGQELTPAEMDYLKNHNPDLYNKAVKAAQDRKDYEASLHRVRTKKEANELHNQTLTRIINEYKNKHGDADEVMMRVNAVQDTHRRFTQSDEYATLDWE